MAISRYMFFMIYMDRLLSVLAALLVATLSWVAYEATIFEAQFSLLAFSVLFIASTENLFRKPAWTWAFASGCSAAFVVISRPAEGFFLVSAFGVISVITKNRTDLKRIVKKLAKSFFFLY